MSKISFLSVALFSTNVHPPFQNPSYACSPVAPCPVRSFHYRLWEIGSVTSWWRFTSWEYIVTAKGERGLILEQFMSKDWNLEWFHINTSMYARVSCDRKISRKMQNFAIFSRNFAFFRKNEFSEKKRNDVEFREKNYEKLQ